MQVRWLAITNIAILEAGGEKTEKRKPPRTKTGPLRMANGAWVLVVFTVDGCGVQGQGTWKAFAPVEWVLTLAFPSHFRFIFLPSRDAVEGWKASLCQLWQGMHATHTNKACGQSGSRTRHGHERRVTARPPPKQVHRKTSLGLLSLTHNTYITLTPPHTTPPTTPTGFDNKCTPTEGGPRPRKDGSSTGGGRLFSHEGLPAAELGRSKPRACQ